MKTPVYHVGLLKQGETLVIEMRRDIDYLNCEIWRYLGQRQVTKKYYKENKIVILQAINSTEGTNFKRIVID